MPEVVEFVDDEGWRIYYRGYRTADIYDGEGRCLNLVQVRPWDWSRDAHEQVPHAVSVQDLVVVLREWKGDMP
jgi:hypothetical protein